MQIAEGEFTVEDRVSIQNQLDEMGKSYREHGVDVPI